jgi:tRNA (adenine-N(1)-)-methyltransferase non-catalytic subunit
MSDQNEIGSGKINGEEALSVTEGNRVSIDRPNDFKSMDVDKKIPDPLLSLPSPVILEGDFVILVFGDGRQIFAQCLKSWKGKSPPMKINKRSYPTANLVGLPYGTVLELGITGLSPLPDGEDIIPDYPDLGASSTNLPSDFDATGGSRLEDDEARADDNTFPKIEQTNDNRNLVDNNTSQSLHQSQIVKWRESGTDGSAIVNALIESSSTFDGKTEFSKAKYIKRKQKKYQPRCRMVRCTPSSVCETLFLKNPRSIMNMREDTLGQILSFSNVSAGCQCLVIETTLGVVTGALAQRMGGYGRVLSIYSGQQPPYLEQLKRFNQSFAENHSIKWLHSGDVFAEDEETSNDPEPEDPEKAERDCLVWPCPLQDHTRGYLDIMETRRERSVFLAKRCDRFARKLTRHTASEGKEWLLSRPCDSVIIVARYDPTSTLLGLLKYLAPSCPFVVYCEFLEPLTECFRELQRQCLAINLRLSDTWMREYQMLPGRTHPSMNMSQNGGFILTGIKLCPVTGHNELDENLLKELRGIVGGRRGKKSKPKNGSDDTNKTKGSPPPAAAASDPKRMSSPTAEGRDSKRARK